MFRALDKPTQSTWNSVRAMSRASAKRYNYSLPLISIDAKAPPRRVIWECSVPHSCKQFIGVPQILALPDPASYRLGRALVAKCGAFLNLSFGEASHFSTSTFKYMYHVFSMTQANCHRDLILMRWTLSFQSLALCGKAASPLRQSRPCTLKFVCVIQY